MDNREKKRRSVRWLRVGLGLLLPMLWAPVSQGQTTAITSSGLNTQVSHGAGSHNYDITGGTRPGNGTNLFHSFGDFSVGKPDVARFLNDAHRPTTNILSRVTGGHVSNIFGQINTTNFPGANLYLINPAGVLFGPTATLNVSGSVHISTADYLRLADGLRFNAIPGPQDTLLSQSPVVAFGFLNPHPRPITANRLQSGVGSTVLSLIGGDVKVSGGFLSASRQINLVSLASRGEVRVGSSGEPSVSGVGQLGTVTLSNNAFVRAGSGPTAGTVVLRAGKLIVDDARIGAGKISIDARESAIFRNSARALDVQGVKGGGEITVDAGQIQLTKSNIIARGEPQGGTVVLSGHGTVLMDNSRIDTGASGAAAVAGKISITAGDLARLTNGTILASDASPQGGKAGTVVIDAGKTFVSDASTISARSVGNGENTRGGTVVIQANNLVQLNRSRVDTGIGAGPRSAQAGSIDIQTGDLLQLLHGTVLTADTGGQQGRGGTVNLYANHAVLMDGSRVVTSTGGGGSSFGIAGSILIKAGDSIRVLNDSALMSVASLPQVTGTGGAGKIVIDADRNIIVDRSSLSIASSGAGSAGELKLTAGDSVQLLHGTSLSAGGFPQSRGPVTITAGKHVLIEASTISAGGGPGGRIGITAGQSVRVLNDSQLSVNHNGEMLGGAGTITIQAGTTFLGQDSSFLAYAQPAFTVGHGGTIQITAPTQVRLTGSLVDTSFAKIGQGSAGGIAITSESVRLHHSQLVSKAKTLGTGGTITIKTDGFHRDAASVLDVSGGKANGTVQIEPLP